MIAKGAFCYLSHYQTIGLVQRDYLQQPDFFVPYDYLPQTGFAGRKGTLFYSTLENWQSA